MSERCAMDRNRMLDRLKKAACRGNSLVMDAALKIMPETVPQIEEGIGCSGHIPDILRRLGITNTAVVTGPTVGRVIAPPILEAWKKPESDTRYTIRSKLIPRSRRLRTSARCITKRAATAFSP